MKQLRYALFGLLFFILSGCGNLSPLANVFLWTNVGLATLYTSTYIYDDLKSDCANEEYGR